MDGLHPGAHSRRFRASDDAVNYGIETTDRIRLLDVDVRPASCSRVRVSKLDLGCQDIAGVRLGVESSKKATENVEIESNTEPSFHKAA